MNSVNVQFVKKSSNSKIGAMPCTNSDKNTCPSSCSLKDNGCYAQSGYYTRMNWDKVTAGERGSNWSDLCSSVSKLKAGQVWRHNVSGDLPHLNQRIDADKVFDLAVANRGKRGFTYTHHDMAHDDNSATVQTANKHGFTINLSADNPTMADKLMALTIAPVVSIVPADQVENFVTSAGNKVVICPAAIRDDVTCLSCKMCSIADRKTIIGFPAHGTTKAKIIFSSNP